MKLLLSILIFVVIQATYAQDLSSHRWQERVLLVISEDTVQIDFSK